MGAALSEYNSLLLKHPVPTNMATGGVLAVAGDVLCQLGLEGADTLDARRTASMSAFGAAYCGYVCPVIYSLYPRVLPKWAVKTPLREGLASSALDNFLHGNPAPASTTLIGGGGSALFVYSCLLHQLRVNGRAFRS